MQMYESPISVSITQLQQEISKQHEEQILKSIMMVGVEVDKEELIKALKYDRRQYEKGYADAKAEIIRCEDCRRYNSPDEDNALGSCDINYHNWRANDFCSFAERREDE